MAQQFQADAQANSNATTLTNGVAITTITGNFLSSPYGNAKVKARGSSSFTEGSVPASIRLQLFRNPASENQLIADSGVMTDAIAANLVTNRFIEGIDLVPDGRPVQYALVITIAGSGTNGATSRNFIESVMLSG